MEKKKKVIVVGMIALLLIGLIGCRATPRAMDPRYNLVMGTGNASGISAVAARDFEPLGIVFAEATASRRNGYGAIHDTLVKEAVQKGADAIINVNIAPTSGHFNRTWSGSALAIRYRD